LPFKFKRHQSIYLDEKLDRQVSDTAASEKKSKNKMINELIRIGLAKRQEEIFALDQIARAIKADLQLQRDELRKQSNRIASLLSKIGLHAIAGRYQTTYVHAKITDGDTAKKTGDHAWKYAVSKLKEKVDKDNDSEE
jgi:hypothetical protein